MHVLEGGAGAANKSFAVVASRFNEMIVGHLVDGAVSVLKRNGVNDDDIWLARVPGAFEIPGVARRLAESGKFAAVICLGTGFPPPASIEPTIEQAIERAGTKAGNKGEEAALAAIEMSGLYEKLDDALK